MAVLLKCPLQRLSFKALSHTTRYTVLLSSSNVLLGAIYLENEQTTTIQSKHKLGSDPPDPTSQSYYWKGNS